MKNYISKVYARVVSAPEKLELLGRIETTALDHGFSRVAGAYLRPEIGPCEVLPKCSNYPPKIRLPPQNYPPKIRLPPQNYPPKMRLPPQNSVYPPKITPLNPDYPPNLKSRGGMRDFDPLGSIATWLSKFFLKCIRIPY